MTFGQFLSILRARRWAALGVFALVVLTTLVVSLLLPKQYLGTASIVIDVKPDPVSAMVNPAAVMPSFMATQVDILTSERVALRVIRDLKLADNPALRQQWQEENKGQGTFEQYLIELLQKGLDVKPSRESNVFMVNYKSPDPRFAAGLANAFAQAYIATTLELRVDPARQFSNFFGAQVKEARDTLEKAQQRVSAFQQAKGIIATDERFDVENARLNELSSQLTQLQALSAESSSRQNQAQGGQAERMQEVLNNPVIGALKADMSRSEARLQELTQRLGDNHPQVQEARANIAEVRKRIESETQRVSGGVGVTANINKGRESSVQRELAAQRAKVLQMKVVRDEGLVLQREIESAQRIYDNLVVRASQSGLEAQNTQSYANMLTTAQPPSEPAGPKVLLNTLLAVFLGTLLAVGVALLLELTDRRVRSPEDVAAALGLPVLGSMPGPKAKHYLPGRPAMLGQARPLGLPGTGPSNATGI